MFRRSRTYRRNLVRRTGKRVRWCENKEYRPIMAGIPGQRKMMVKEGERLGRVTFLNSI
ncbi:hypothetical protein SAMN04488112_107105 [Melghirimyces thermohalophilus]|uniref:Uncharacterized protein n=1 Tax=Melghirimyces thermohalophilus TaxID=1236220 RepID=A0A1G6LAF2_9BACL|nr:hypothetical protein SAMN04488112_107105 [Melghirimyces thermohalophilus]